MLNPPLILFTMNPLGVSSSKRTVCYLTVTWANCEYNTQNGDGTMNLISGFCHSDSLMQKEIDNSDGTTDCWNVIM